MFFLPGSNAFSLKVIIPTNFNVTDGSYTDYLQDELSNSRPQVSYTIRGYFTSPVEKACFSVLRGNKEATSTSLFELRHEFYLSATGVDRQGRQAGEATCPGTGSITYERWNDISGTSITDLTGKTNNLQAPASSSQNLTRFEAPTNVADNYGVRMRGYICPPTTGTYYFWIAGDDNVSLRLNGTGNNPAGATQIAYHNGWTDPQMWNRFSEQKSVAINLTAGQQYYVEALMKEGGGGDNLAVGWAKPEEATGQPSEVIPGQYLIPFTTTTTTTAGIVAGKCYSIQDLQSLRYAQRMADNRVMMLDRDVKNDNQLWKVDVTGSQFRFISQGGSATDLLYVDALQNGQSLRVGPSVDNERYRWSMALSNNGGYRIFGGVNQITWDQANAGQNDDLQLFGDNINQADSHWDKPYRRFSFAEAACSSGTVNCNLAAVASPSSVASGATSTLTVSGGGNGASYSWRVGNNQVGTGSSVSVTPTTTTTYQVDCANCGGCIAGQATVTVTNSPPPVSQLTVSPSQVSWATNSNSQYIAVTSNVSWTLSGLPANGWLTASSTNGSGNGSFTLSAQANPMMSSRTATLTVSGGNLTQTITVTQAGATATAGATTCIESESGALTALDIQNNNGASGGRFIGNFGSPASYVVFPVTVPTAGTYTITFAYGAGEAGSFGVSVNGGASQTQTYPATGWTFQTLSFSVALPAGSSTFKVAGQNNAGFWFDKLCISSGGGGSCNLVAAASPGSINSGATSTLTVSGGGNSANYVWKAGGNQIGTGSSVSVTPTTTTTYQVDCANCGGCIAGQATVTVTNSPPPVSQLTVSPSQVSWATNSNSQYIAVTSNVSWTLSGLPANGWLTASSTNGSGNGSFTLSAQANPMMSSRTATLTVSGGNLTQTITVTQAGATATAGATTCIESESGALTALDIQNNNGASGGRFIGNFGSPASYVVFPVTVPTAGTYTITFAYGAGEAGSFGVSVNGGASQTQTYPATGWTFQTLSFSVALPAGSSTFKVAGQNNAGFWFDKLCISSGGGGSCNLVAAASPGSINSGATSTLTVSGGGNSANYVWKAGGNQIGTGSSVSVTPTTTTTYQVDCANCGGCVAGQATVTVNATNGDQPIYNLATQRRIGMQITEDCSVHTSYGKAYIDAAVAAGIDYVQILVEWSKVRQSDGSLNFSRIDEDVAYALSKGLKLGFRLSLVGDWNVPGRIPWSSSEGHMGDNFGVKHHQNGVAVMSLNHTPTLLEAEIFVRTFATRLNTNTTWRNNILMMSVCQSTILETNYPMDNYDQEQTSTGQHRVEFGWEAASLIKYRDRLKGWFGNSLSAYKTWANSSVTDWSEIMPPTPANASPDEGFGFPFKTQKLWYYHKHLSLREFHEQMLGAIHSINQNWNLTSEISSVNVQINPQMITSGAGLLLPDFVKGMKLNNDYNSNHKLTTELSFRQRLPDQWTMTECGANSQTADQNVQHGRGFFQNDGNVFFIAQPMAAGDNNNDALRNAGITLLGDVITRLKAQFPTLVDVPRTPALNAGSPVEISLYNVCGSNYQQDNVIGGYKAITGNGPKIVYIKDDLLQKTLTP